MRKLTVLLCAALILFANTPARSAMPPHGPYEKGCRPDNVRAVLQHGTMMAFDCFQSLTGMNATYGVWMHFSPEEERYSTGGATTSTLQVFVSKDPSCPIPHDGSTFSLTDPCLLIEGTSLPDKGMSYVNTCAGRWKSPMMAIFLIGCHASGPPTHSSGTITFVHWAAKAGGRLEFKFSPNAQLTEYIADPKAPGGVGQATIKISGSAFVELL